MMVTLVTAMCLMALCFEHYNVTLEEEKGGGGEGGGEEDKVENATCSSHRQFRLAKSSEIISLYETGHINASTIISVYPTYNTTDLLLVQKIHHPNHHILFGVFRGIGKFKREKAVTDIICIRLRTHEPAYRIIFLLFMLLVFLFVIGISITVHTLIRKRRQL